MSRKFYRPYKPVAPIGHKVEDRPACKSCGYQNCDGHTFDSYKAEALVWAGGEVRIVSGCLQMWLGKRVKLINNLPHTNLLGGWISVGFNHEHKDLRFELVTSE